MKKTPLKELLTAEMKSHTRTPWPSLATSHPSTNLYIQTFFFSFPSESRAKIPACIAKVTAHIHTNPITYLFFDTMPVVARVGWYDSFLVFDQCCHHKFVLLDTRYTQSVCLQHSEDLPFDKIHLLVHNLGGKVTKL